MYAVQDSISDLNLGLSTKLTTLRNDLIEAVKMETNPQSPPKCASGKTTSFLESLETIKEMIAHLQSSIVDMPIQQRILRQLAYEEMASRHLKIKEPEAGTLRWMLGQAAPLDQDSDPANGWDDIVRSDASQKYLAWLQEGTGVFHLSGNTGSGKSALMKYLAGHEITRRNLELWTGTRNLVLANFYFWAPGNELQRSLDGMRRTLLFGTLSQHPELMEKIFPRQWRRMKASSRLTDPLVEGIQEFGQRQIDDAFAMLVEGRDFFDCKLCFFIDGLDELNGDKQDHENFAEQICSWAKASNVKLCVSSRPYIEFVEIFQSFGHTTIYLHQLNEPDIYAYCREKFNQDRKGKLLAVGERQQLANQITEKSRGVFLWTFLVVRQLLNALRNDDPLHVLKKRLDEVPQELGELYTKSLESVSKSEIDKTRAYRILLLALENPLDYPLDALAFSWIPDFDELESPSLQDANFLIEVNTEAYSDAEIRRRLKRVTAQIRGLTRDFLEVSYDIETKNAAEFTVAKAEGNYPWVEFFHRSARDYLLEHESRRTALHCSWPDFDAEVIYFKVCFALMNLGASEYFNYGISIYLRTLCNQENGLSILRRLQTSVMRRGAYKPLWAQFPSTISMSKKKAPVFDLSSDSFVHVAAHNGLEKFVLEEVNLTPGLLSTGNDLNLLVSAALGPDHWVQDLVGKLLDLHADLDGTHPIRDEGTGLTERWPVWVVVSIALMQRSLRGIVSTNGVLKVVRDLERIYRYAIDQGWNAAMTFTVWPEWKDQLSETTYESQQIDLGEFVRFGQTFDPGPIQFYMDGGWVSFLLGNEIGMKGISNAKYEIHRFTWGSDK